MENGKGMRMRAWIVRLEGPGVCAFLVEKNKITLNRLKKTVHSFHTPYPHGFWSDALKPFAGKALRRIIPIVFNLSTYPFDLKPLRALNYTFHHL